MPPTKWSCIRRGLSARALTATGCPSTRASPFGSMHQHSNGPRELAPWARFAMASHLPPFRCLVSFPCHVRPPPSLLKGELMRYLAELPWAPDALLANPWLAWRAHSDCTLSWRWS